MKSILLMKALLATSVLLMSSFSLAQENIQLLANKWAAAYNSFDGEALADLYTENAHLYLHGSPMLIGQERIREFWENDFTINNPMTVLTVTHSVEGFDMMLVHGNYQVLARETAEVLGSGRFAHIWHKVDEDWKLDQDLWNQPYEE